MDRVDRGLLESVDARTKLAGSNRMEILLFSLGTQEIFGINVFKVREVSRTPFITKAPNMPIGVEGLISLRGNVIPVLALAKVMGIAEPGEPLGNSMMVTEYSKRTLGFLVHEVDRIIRVDWDKVRAPDNVTSSSHNFITAITELQDGKLVSILDVETILASTFGEAVVGQIHPLEGAHDVTVFFVDDSSVARKKIAETLDKLGVKHKHALNGLEAWTRLEGMAGHAQQRRSAQDGTGVTEDPVRQNSTEERRQVHKEHVRAVDAGGFSLGHLVILGEVEREQRQHQIEAEALPRLREEKYVKAARMLARHLGTSHLAIATGNL